MLHCKTLQGLSAMWTFVKRMRHRHVPEFPHLDTLLPQDGGKRRRGHFESAIKQAQIERVRGERGRGEVKEVECVRMGFEIFSWTGYSYRPGPATTTSRDKVIRNES